MFSIDQIFLFLENGYKSSQNKLKSIRFAIRYRSASNIVGKKVWERLGIFLTGCLFVDLAVAPFYSLVF